MQPLFAMAFLEGAAEFLRSLDPHVHRAVLLLTIFWPLAGAVGLAFGGRMTPGATAFAGRLSSLIPALGGLWLWAAFLALDPLPGEYLFLYQGESGLQSLGIRLFFGLNAVSMPLFAMAGLVSAAAGWYAAHAIQERPRLFFVLLLVMQTGLMGFFASIDLFFYYFFHEFALIPTFIMIAIWGRQERKVVALELTVYLTLGAMLSLGGLLLLYWQSGARSFDFLTLQGVVRDLPWETSIYGLLLIGFGILVSLFPFHSWAPRGYATAPAPAAMLHAGVLKKFGLYGLIQFVGPLLPEGAAAWAPWLMWLALGNIVIIGLVTLVQRDLKYMLGNASVMHMGYAFLGIYAASSVGIGGAVLMMFAHGLSVALLFMLADCIERRTGTLDMDQLGGLGEKAPVLMAFFVAATMASIGLPGFANFWGELTIFVALWQSSSPWVTVVALTGIVISAIYGLRAVGRIFFGPSSREYVGGDLRYAERLPALLLLAALFAIGFWPRLVSDDLDQQLADTYPPAPMALNSLEP